MCGEKLQEKISENERKEFERIMRGTPVSLFGNSINIKEVKQRRIQTMSIYCWIASIAVQKKSWEFILKKAFIVVSFQLPKESLEKN